MSAPVAAGLDVDVTVAAGSFDLQMALAVASGEVVALLGPNGAGKTTALRALAGLHRIAAGHIALDGTDLDRRTPPRWVAPERRPVAMVFQDLRLFPTMTARENVAFGLRSRGLARGQARARADTWLGRVGLADRAGDRPDQLSGGQAQRVGLARALAIDPALLLLDEPLSALDVATRADVRRELRSHLDAFAGAAIVVTHDAVDALTLADRLVVLDAGRVVQQGPPAEVARRPRSAWVADLVGVTLLAGTAVDHERVRTEVDGPVLVTRPFGAAYGIAAGAHVYLAVRPRAVALYRDRPAGSPRNVWHSTVTGIDAVGDQVRVQTDGQLPMTAEITPAALAELALAPGDAVWVAIKATELDVYPR